MKASVCIEMLFPGLPFEERKLRFDFTPGSAFRRELANFSPSGKVPVLLDDDFAVWDSLAIIEYLHDKFPGHGVWPEGMRERARARSLAAEMHSGFNALRSLCPMNIEAALPDVGARLWQEHAALRSDVARIEGLWAEALLESGGEPLLCGSGSCWVARYDSIANRSAAASQIKMANPTWALWEI